MFYLCKTEDFGKKCLKLIGMQENDVGTQIDMNPFMLVFIFLLCVFLVAYIVRIISWAFYLIENKSCRYRFTDKSDKSQLEKHFLSFRLYLGKPRSNYLNYMSDLVFGNSVYFNNMDKLNIKITLKTVLLVMHLTFTYLLFKFLFSSKIVYSQLEFVALLASFPTIFWHHHSVFYNKWKHCAEMVHTYLMLNKEEPVLDFSIDVTNRESDYQARFNNYNTSVLQLKHSILIDMIHLEMWSHKSFYRIFNGILIERLFSIENEKLSIDLAKKYAYGEMSEDDLENFLRDRD